MQCIRQKEVPEADLLYTALKIYRENLWSPFISFKSQSRLAISKEESLQLLGIFAHCRITGNQRDASHAHLKGWNPEQSDSFLKSSSVKLKGRDRPNASCTCDLSRGQQSRWAGPNSTRPFQCATPSELPRSGWCRDERLRDETEGGSHDQMSPSQTWEL